MTFHKSITLAVVLALLINAAVALSAFAAPSDRATLRGSAPAWANSKNYKGAADANAGIGFRVYLGWNNASAAEALAKAVSDPHSSSYRHYLTPAQFRQQFAPSQAQAGQVQSWLRSQGFAVNYTPGNNHYVSAEGTVAQASAAFGTSFGLYNVRGQTVGSPSSDVTVPASLASVVNGVIGLDDSSVFITTNHIVDKNAPPSAGFRNAPPFSAYWAEIVSPYAYPSGFTAVTSPAKAPWAVKGYTPQQIKAAYGIFNQYDGAGQTVAVMGAYASPTILQDVNQWSINRGLPPMNSGQLVQVVPPGVYKRPQNKQQDPQGWYGEETMDIEAVHGMAPAARIVYVGAPNNEQDVDAAMNHVVDKHLAQIVTNSYDFPTTELLPFGYVKPLEDTLIQAAIEGIGMYFASGDNGDETVSFGFATVDWPASSPWVTAVGGTSLGIGADNARVLETGWGTSNYNCDKMTLVCTKTRWLFGSGGGVSPIFAKPFYQSGLSLSGRGVPDVAALGDPQTGFLVGQTQSFAEGNHYDEFREGGTSLSSPIFAGLMALADQAAGHPHGFANPLFYAHSGVFYDVLSVKTAVARSNYVNNVDDSAGTVDRLRTLDDYSGSPTQHTNPGWDNVTGLGTPTSSFLSTFGH